MKIIENITPTLKFELKCFCFYAIVLLTIAILPCARASAEEYLPFEVREASRLRSKAEISICFGEKSNMWSQYCKAREMWYSAYDNLDDSNWQCVSYMRYYLPSQELCNRLYVLLEGNKRIQEKIKQKIAALPLERPIVP
jgi:hypothetical protein